MEIKRQAWRESEARHDSRTFNFPGIEGGLMDLLKFLDWRS